MYTASVMAIKARPFADNKQPAMMLRCPSDKSLTHRSVIFAAMACGTSYIRQPLAGEDCHATLQAFTALGVQSQINDDTWSVQSPGSKCWKSPTQSLDFANSGTSARLLTGLFAATPGLNVSCFGDASLSRRPMRRVVDPLRQMGAVISGPNDAQTLPLQIMGQHLSPICIRIEQASAQIKSALLLAAMQTTGTSEIIIPAGARDHTERWLARCGANIRSSEHQGWQTISFHGPFEPAPFSVRVPCDPSSAAFFMVLAALRPELRLTLSEVLDNPTRTGAIAKLAAAGVRLGQVPSQSSEFCEPALDWKIEAGKELMAFHLASHEIPTLVDEVPILAVLAAFACGTSYFTGLEELRVKESDRLAKISELLSKAGVKHAAGANDLRIEGCGPQAWLRGFEFDCDGDHRLAMAAAILATRCDSTVRIAQANCVAVSFPAFYDFLNACNVATFVDS